jgi:PAS domain S-box-containing protein
VKTQDFFAGIPSNKSIVIHLSSSCEIISINEAAASIFNCDREAFVGRSLFEVAIENCWPLPFVRHPTLQFHDMHHEYEIFSGIPYGNDENTLLLIGKTVDLPRKIAQFCLESLLLRIPGSVYWKDKNGVYLGCNAFQAKMAGFTFPEDIIGKTDYELSWKEIADVLVATDQRIMQTGETEELVETPRLLDGTELVMLTQKSPLYDHSGNLIGVIGTSLDMTALKEAETREREALIAKATAQAMAKEEESIRKAVIVLAGSIAHDLRSPLQSVRIMSQVIQKYLPNLLEGYSLARGANLLVSDDITDRCREYLTEAHLKLNRIADEMNTFINDTLKSLAHAVSHNLKQEDLVECLSEQCIIHALQSYPFQDNERDLVHVDKSYRFSFMGNAVLFLRMIFNLFQNAFYQINSKGQGHIYVSSRDMGDFNAIYVKDTAGGVSSENIDIFFEGYRTTKVGGTGIGLAFCKWTMNSFGGDIRCRVIEDEDAIEFALLFPKISKEKVKDAAFLRDPTRFKVDHPAGGIAH